MHEIRFWLGLCPRPRWGSSQLSPNPLAGFKGCVLLLREREWREGGGKEGDGKREGEEGEDGEGS